MNRVSECIIHPAQAHTWMPAQNRVIEKPAEEVPSPRTAAGNRAVPPGRQEEVSGGVCDTGMAHGLEE